MRSLPSDAEFLVHVGDIRDASDRTNCTNSEYEAAAEILKLSPAPVLVVPGDNEWTDCPNVDEGWRLWNFHFLNFESRLYVLISYLYFGHYTRSWTHSIFPPSNIFDVSTVGIIALLSNTRRGDQRTLHLNTKGHFSLA